MSATVFLATTERAVAETAGVVEIEFRRAGSLSGEVTLIYDVVGNTATAGVDFSGAGGTVVIPDGAASVTVPITILDDALGEATEVLAVTLVSATGATATAPRTTRLSILDDETPAPPPPAEPSDAPAYALSYTPLAGELWGAVRFAFNPLDADQVFVGRQGGQVHVADLSTGATSLLLDLSAQVNSVVDRGLVGLTVHPDLANNPYLYLFYVVDPPETATLTGNASQDGMGNRYAHLVRYTLDAATGYTSVVADSAVVLLGAGGASLADISGGGVLDFSNPANAAQPASDRYIDPADPTPPALIGGFKQDYLKVDAISHAGGALEFGPDGMLYVATGDGTSPNFADPRSPDVLNPNSLMGKILRIDPLTGDGLADNPFVTPGMDLDSNAAKVFQLGLRNPFGFAVGEDGRVVIADVGWFEWEEINQGGPGANFGWPWFEGADGGLLNRTSGYRDLPGAAAFYAAVEAGSIEITAPFRAFHHARDYPGYEVQAIIGGGVIYTGNRYPTEFQNDFFFGDFSGGRFFSLDVQDSADLRLVGNFGGMLHLEQGADGYLYAANAFAGTIGRIDITALPAFNPAPQSLVSLRDAVLTDAATRSWRLTSSDVAHQLGGVASATRIDLRQDARFVFDLNFGAADFFGAEGMGFALHNDPEGARGFGGANQSLGIEGLERAIAIEFDTWQTGDDIANDHGRIFAPGNAAFGTGVNGQVDFGNVEDGAWHRVEVTWTAATGRLAYSLDGVARDSRTGGIIETALGGGHFAHLLITGAANSFRTEFQARIVALDVTYEDIAAAQAPVLFGGALRALSVAENTTGVIHTPFATDAEGAALSWRILPGLDGARFAINATTGALSFLAPPDFEAPTDAGADNLYELAIEVSDPGGLTATQRIEISVTNIAVEEIRGNAGANRLVGTAGGDVMIGLGGADTLLGGAGNDSFRATDGDGNDLMAGAAGRDLYSLADTNADAEVSLVARRAGSAATGADTLTGVEDVIGGGGNDRIAGDRADNALTGGAGADTLVGDFGTDTLTGGLGADRLEGGRGSDSFVFASPAEGGDALIGYIGREDSLLVSAAGFGGGLVAGMNVLTTGRYASNNVGLSNAPAGTGQFVFERDTFLLRWDADGRGPMAGVVIADLTGARGWSGSEIVVIA